MTSYTARQVRIAALANSKSLATPLVKQARGKCHRSLDIDRLGALTGVLTVVFWAMVMMTDAGPADQAREAARAAGRTSEATNGPEWLSGGYFGAPLTHASDMRFVKPGTTDLTAHDIQWDGKPFKSPIYYGLRSVRWNGTGQGVMVDFTHSKTISQPDQRLQFSGTRNGRAFPASAAGTARNGDVFKHLEFSHGHNMLTLNRLWRLGRLTPAIWPYAGAGVGVSLPHTEIQFTDEDQRTYEYQYAGPVGQVLAGVEIRLPRVSVFIEYKFTLARNSVPLSGNDSRGWGYGDFFGQLSRWWRGEAPMHGTATTTLASHQIIGGVGVRSAVAAPAP